MAARQMLPLNARGKIVEACDFTREIDEKSIRSHIQDLNQKWKSSNVGDDDDYQNTHLHAEVIMRTTEADERRANELLNLMEQSIVRLLGNVYSRVETSVITHQKLTDTTLVIYSKGVKIAARAYGLSSVPLAEMEDFLVEKASVEYIAMFMRFYKVDTLHSPNLTVNMEGTGRTLRVQRSPGAFISRNNY